MLSVVYGECCVFVVLSVIMLNVFILSDIRLEWKGLPRTNSLAYYNHLQIMDVYFLIKLAPVQTAYKVV